MRTRPVPPESLGGAPRDEGAVATIRCLVAFVLTLAVTGCSPIRPVPALLFRRAADAPERCLVVMFPGVLDGADRFPEHGFESEVVRSGAECDSVALELHLRYYQEIGLGQIVYEDILYPASARGYDEIWLVGVSMGGLGALLTAEAHPELVSGIILLSPYVGEEPVLREIISAGGAEAWHPPADIEEQPWTQSNYTAHLWSWLRGYATDPDDLPPLYIGWAEHDWLGAGDLLLASIQPEDHVILGPGGHGWSTWRPMFRQFLEMARPGR
jgi:hypothetical protein